MQTTLEPQPAVLTHGASGQTLPAVFLGTVRSRGPEAALRYKKYGLWHDVSWDRYYDHVKYVALALREMGLEKGDRVAILGDNGPEWVTIDLGVQCAGGVTVGIYATSAWQQCRYIVSHAEARFLFVENEEQLDKWLRFRHESPALHGVVAWDLEGLRGFTDPMFTPFDALLERGRAAAQAHPGRFEEFVAEVQPDDAAMFVYTSGTTGPPKGAVLTHRNLTWAGRVMATYDPDLPVQPEDEVMSFLPLCHIFERFFSVVAHLTCGYTVSFVESPDTVPDNLREISPTLGYGVPRLWEKYASVIRIRMGDATWLKRTVFGLALRIGRSHAERKLSCMPIPIVLQFGYHLACFTVFRKLKERLGFDRMRFALSGAAPIAPEVLYFYHAIGVDMAEGYGQTESTGILTGTRLGDIRPGTVGRAMPGVELRLAEDGEILARSPGVFQGYYKDPEKTSETIDTDGWLHTGDIGEIDDDGFVRIVDRKKDLIITAGGKNIAPQYIENKLKFSAYITDAVVVGNRRKYLTALIVLDEDNVVKYAKDHKTPYSTYADLADNADINRLIRSEVDRVNAELSRVEQVRKFCILPKRLYEEDGEVTPTMKVKRSAINETYLDLIESMYSDGGAPTA